MAAVSPAGPEPMMMTSRVANSLKLTVPLGLVAGSPASGPQEQPEEREDSADRRVGRPHVARDGDVDGAHERDGQQDEGGHAEDGGDDPVDDDAHDALERVGGLAA